MRVLLLCVLVVAGLAAGPATASEPLSDFDLKNVALKVNTKGEALVLYQRADGTQRRVLVWGAVNARVPDPVVPQVRFKYDYAGGWGKYRTLYWKTFKDSCKRYDGPALAYLIKACKAPDGTFWAVQLWQRELPLLGFDPWLPKHTRYELHISHWSGPLAKLEVSTNFTYGGSARGVFGRFMYLDKPIHGFGSTSTGNPKDRYGRNVFIDTFNSAYGPGWKRESGILLHRPTGTFCHSFVPQKPFPDYPNQQLRPAAPGDRYRFTVMGPGVMPVIQEEIAGVGEADRNRDPEFNALFDRIMAGDSTCAPER